MPIIKKPKKAKWMQENSFVRQINKNPDGTFENIVYEDRDSGAQKKMIFEYEGVKIKTTMMEIED